MIPAVAGVLVGAAMCVAGGTKIAASRTWPEQARAMGAPAFIVPLLPWIEILLGAALVARLAPVVCGTAAIVMLTAFTALILVNLARGRRPACACFGAWRSTPLGWKHV
ncbi:MAG: MauE/DoxX family redox-associated membrane protein, partial [Actinomycetota bacterium]